MNKDWRLYLKLFTSTFYLSAFTFGGGYVIITLMKKKFVDDLKWIKEEEMLDLMALSQSSPGAIAINASILIGYRIAGILGSLVTILGTIIPPLIILSIVSIFYAAFKDNAIVNAVLKGMQAGISAVIVDVVYSMGSSVFKRNKDIKRSVLSAFIMVSAFIATFVFNVNVFYIIIISGLLGLASAYYWKKFRKEQDNA